MGYRSGLVSGVLGTLLVLGAAGASWWLATQPAGKEKPPASPAPARVAQLAREESFNTLTLTDEAATNLALKDDAVVRRRTMPRRRVYGAEVLVPPGRTAVVAAPLPGTLRAPPDGQPQPGSLVKQGQAVFTLLPLLGPEGRANLAAAHVEAEGQVKSARTQVDATRVALTRARRLVDEQAGSRRNLDEAQAAFDLAGKALDAATARRDLLARVLGDIEKGTAAAVELPSPAAGILRNVTALPGQVVPAGAALFEVFDPDRVWLRVPVYVADLPTLDATASVHVGDLADVPGDSGRVARPVPAPPTANAQAGTADLYYELPNRDERPLRPGQRVAVTVPLRGDDEGSLTVPWAAVVFDVHGGAWVYARAAPRTYVRRRVVVRHVVGATAVLDDGPPEGTRVVTEGAAELFGTEVGFGK